MPKWNWSICRVVARRSIECGPSTNAQLPGAKAPLTKGKYRLEVLVATRDIVPQGDPKGSGVGSRSLRRNAGMA